MPRARKRSGGGGGGSDGPSKAWLDSYADAMTLLLAFFVLLYASSLIDEDKFIDFKIGVAEALGKPNPTLDGGIGILERGNGVATLVAAPPVLTTNGDGSEGENPTGKREVTEENAEDLASELRSKVAEVGAEPFVDVVNDPRGVVIRLDSQVLFRSGDAKVLPDGVIVLGQIGPVLNGLDNLLIVEGHTDNVPTNGSRWPTNWELSAARGVTVVRYLVEIEGLPAAQVSGTSYADTRPRVSNSTPEGRTENRRVEIVVLVSRNGEPTIAPVGLEGEDSAHPSGDFEDLLDLDPAAVDLAEE